MALELNTLTGQVEKMARTMAERQTRLEDLVTRARAKLADHDQDAAGLPEKISRARDVDASWRGAAPLDCLNGRSSPVYPRQDVTLIAVDGSQIYPDPHGIATYYLLNTGSIVLRQGSGRPPQVCSKAHVFFEEADLYDDGNRLRDVEYINQRRQQAELASAVELAEAERLALGGDIARPVLALSDGPLLPWTSQRAREADLRRTVEHMVEQLARLRQAYTIPVGYIDRPNSAYILRSLELADLAIEQIDRAHVRHGPFRQITDRLLFGDLRPGERTALFSSTSDLNERFGKAGHRVVFFYANVARLPGPAYASIARIELPEWAAHDPAKLDCVQNALCADSELTGYPYVLARAHELAVVGSGERAEFEGMIERSMLRSGLRPVTSVKAAMKRLTGGHRQ